MEGFFTKKETETIDRIDGKTLSCFSCGLFKKCLSPKMPPYGNFKKKILNIGEAPGEVEDRSGKPFQGVTGTLLRKMYRNLGIDLFEDCLNINAVHCRPVEAGENREPTNYEIECCRKTTLQTIYEYKPKVIVLLGNSAVYSIIGHRWKKDLGGITKWRGWSIPDRDMAAWICPTFHPSYVERAEASDVELIWKQDLQQAIECSKTPLPPYVEPTIEEIKDLSVLNTITSGMIAFDYETTGLKPHAEGHRIVCCSIANSENHAYVFMMPLSKIERKPFTDLLANPNVSKIAHNMKYEEAWSFVRLKQPVENWYWDTMQATHILDNRVGVTSLKFQAYVQFGIVDYASALDFYLKPKTIEGANDKNKIFELLQTPDGKKKLLKYCGLDAIYEYRLAMKQLENFLPF